MSSETSLVASQFRLQNWAAMVSECQKRPQGMTVKAWCADHGITKADYYYRLGCVRKAFLDRNGASFEPFVEVTIPPVASENIPEKKETPAVSAVFHRGEMLLEIYDSASPEFLKKLIKAAADA